MSMERDVSAASMRVAFDAGFPGVEGYPVREPSGCCVLPNGVPLCIGCGRMLPKARDWNQCADCDTRTHEDY